MTALKSRLSDAQKLVDEVLASLDRKPLGRPQARWPQRVACEIINMWDRLKELQCFTAEDVKKMITDSYCRSRSKAAFSSTLSDWAKEGYIEIVEQGSGPKPTFYKIPPG
jgi:hypothetical protein